MMFVQQVSVLMQREWYRIRSEMPRTFLYYVVLWPCYFSLSTGYFSGLALFGEQGAVKGTEMMVGVALMHLCLISFIQTIGIVKERVFNKMVQYQVSVTSYPAVFTARFLFGVLYAIVLAAPYLMTAKLVLGERLYTDQLCWSQLVLVQACVVFCLFSYLFFLIGGIKNFANTGSIWKRMIEPMMWVGGMWAPGYAIAKAFPNLKTFFMINPFYYATEGMRQAFFHAPRFLPLSMSCAVLLGFGSVFAIAAYFLIKHRLEML